MEEATAKRLRAFTEQNAAQAVDEAELGLPIVSEAELIQLAQEITSGVTPATIRNAMRNAYISLPLRNLAEVLEFINRLVDVMQERISAK